MTRERLQEIAQQVQLLAGEIAPARDFGPSGASRVDGELEQIANDLRTVGARINKYLPYQGR